MKTFRQAEVLLKEVLQTVQQFLKGKILIQAVVEVLFEGKSSYEKPKS